MTQRRPAIRRKGHSLLKALFGVPGSMLMGGGAKAPPAPPSQELPPALPGVRREIASRAGNLSFYEDGPAPVDGGPRGVPLLLIHSVNAAGCAYEVRPLFAHYRGQRPVYALELPGFGFSERSDREYTPRLMTDAILAMAEEIGRNHGPVPFDALAVSLSCEFLARAASEDPAPFRTLALVSPTGFDKAAPYDGPAGSHRGKPFLKRAFTVPLWRERFFRLLTTRATIRYFLQKAWGSKDVDEGLLDYDYKTTHQPGASYAPFYFVSGFLFSRDITRVYRSLGCPVLMVHGERGDFVDYAYEDRMKGRAGWTFHTFPTGAMPYFEVPSRFIAAYDRFLAGQSDGAVVGAAAH